MAKIVVVDDENSIVDLLCVFIENEGHKVTGFSNSKVALEYLENNIVDALILDIMMPEIDGLEILKNVRKKYDYPVILLTAKTNQSDVLKGLYLGADDYIKKPFDNLELIARLNVHLKRYGSKADNIISYRNISLDMDKHTFLLNDHFIDLTPTEFQIIEILMKNINSVISSEEIFEKVWEQRYLEKDSNTVSVHIKNIRYKTYKVDKSANFIKTVWGVGYKIE